jgi:heat shock protein HslJ
MKIYTLVILLIAFILTGCGQQSPSPQPGGNNSARNLTGVEWRFTGFTFDGEETPVVPGSTVTLTIGVDNQAGGSGGCNSYGGQYRVDGSEILFSSLVNTDMLCMNERVMQQESWFINALENAHEFEIVGNRLNIFYRDGLGTLHFVAGN